MTSHPLEIKNDRDTKIKENYDVFCQQIESLISQHGFGKFVLLIDKKIVDVFDTQKDAFKAGEIVSQQGIFSVQEIIKSPVNLGIYSYREIVHVNH